MHIRHEAKQAAHYLAKYASSHHENVWIEDAPNCIDVVLMLTKILSSLIVVFRLLIGSARTTMLKIKSAARLQRNVETVKLSILSLKLLSYTIYLRLFKVCVFIMSFLELCVTMHIVSQEGFYYAVVGTSVHQGAGLTPWD